jgi:hypothetical protein
VRRKLLTVAIRAKLYLSVDLPAIKKRTSQLKKENELLEKEYEVVVARGWAKLDLLDRKNQELKTKLKDAKDELSSDEDTE